VYELTDAHGRRMQVLFVVKADEHHLPVALASMMSKYVRQQLMARMQQWFAARLPEVKPTEGYGSDGKRFWQEVQPHLATLAVEPNTLRRDR